MAFKSDLELVTGLDGARNSEVVNAGRGNAGEDGESGSNGELHLGIVLIRVESD